MTWVITHLPPVPSTRAGSSTEIQSCQTLYGISLSSTETQRTHWALLLLMHSTTVTPHWTMVTESTSEYHVSHNPAGWRVQEENSVFLAPQNQTTCFTKHAALSQSFCFWRILGLPSDSHCFIMKWLTSNHSNLVFRILRQYRPYNYYINSLPSEPPGKPKNTGVGILSLLQGIFPTQESNWGLLHCGWILYQLSYQGSP